MEPVPYQISEDDVDEVLNAYEPPGGGTFPEELRADIRAHVMRHVQEIDEIVRSAAEEPLEGARGPGVTAARATSIADRPGDQSYDRRDMALGAIEDLLIREGFIQLTADEARVFPPAAGRDTERAD